MNDQEEPRLDPNDVKSAIRGWIILAIITIAVLGAGLIYLEM